jgi:hypothetical protein
VLAGAILMSGVSSVVFDLDHTRCEALSLSLT